MEGEIPVITLDDIDIETTVENSDQTLKVAEVRNEDAVSENQSPDESTDQTSDTSGFSAQTIEFVTREEVGLDQNEDSSQDVEEMQQNEKQNGGDDVEAAMFVDAPEQFDETEENFVEASQSLEEDFQQSNDNTHSDDVSESHDQGKQKQTNDALVAKSTCKT